MDERRQLWIATYTAAIGRGYSSTDAKWHADRAVEAFEQRFLAAGGVRR
jgi:hypothetical protein